MYRIEDFVAYDDFEIIRTITIPSGQILQTIWFTVKKRYSDTDPQAIISKTATAVASDEGWIEDTGIDDEALVHFYLLPEDTGLLIPFSEYPYSIKTLLTTGVVTTPETGIIVASPAVRTGIT